MADVVSAKSIESEPEPIVMPSWSIVLFMIAACFLLGSLLGFVGDSHDYIGSIVRSCVVAAVFVALGRILNYANEIVIRLRRMQKPDNPR
ncbi:MAG TPA: hypothetical protein VKX17_12135 [Planctomycetota bacterium]|nr:hypothetical protein [Planctomycetota bacterium]